MLETIEWLVKELQHYEIQDFRVKLLHHGQMLEIGDALITEPSDQSTQNRRRWNLLPRYFQDQSWINVPIPIPNLEMLTNRNGH